MAEKNIQMTQRNSTNDGWDDIHPRTKASNVLVQDANNRFAGTNVEAVLNELFTFANNGKTDIASVIGSPATSGDSFSQLKTHIQDRKNELALNLSAKGQASAGTETLDSLVDKVALVNTGKKWASGTGTVVTNTSSTGYLEVKGLTFKPSLILMTQGSFVFSLYKEGFYNNYYVSYAQINLKQMETATTDMSLVSETGFKIMLWNQNSKVVNWTAYE